MKIYSAKKYRIMALAMTFMLALTEIKMTDSVFAANTGDESWTIFFAPDSSAETIFARVAVQDSTGIYIKWTASYGGNLSEIWVSPYGAETRTSPLVPAGTMAGGRKSYVMPGPGQYIIPNYAYAMGMPYMTFGMRAKTGCGTATGVWSRDNTGNYSILH